MTDRELTELQETGVVAVTGKSIADVLEGLNKLGINPAQAFISQNRSSWTIDVEVIEGA